MLKALGDETRFRCTASSPDRPGAARPKSSPTRSACTPTPCGCTSIDCARPAWSTSKRSTGAPSAGPTHIYSLAPGAPGLGFDPPSYTLLSGLLAALAERVGADGDEATEIGRAWGVEAGRRTRSRSCVKALTGEMERLGFEPETETSGKTSDMAFMRCPFRELAEAYPELVCNLHRGISEGIVAEVGGGTVEDFATLYDRDPCRVTVAVR